MNDGGVACVHHSGRLLMRASRLILLSLIVAVLAVSISAKLRNGYIREPHVAVEVEAYRPFFILGEVTAPGQYPYVAHMSVETAVAIAGGFTPRAYKKTVELSRPVNGELYRGKVPLTYQ